MELVVIEFKTRPQIHIELVNNVSLIHNPHLSTLIKKIERRNNVKGITFTLLFLCNSACTYKGYVWGSVSRALCSEKRSTYFWAVPFFPSSSLTRTYEVGEYWGIPKLRKNCKTRAEIEKFCKRTYSLFFQTFPFFHFPSISSCSKEGMIQSLSCGHIPQPSTESITYQHRVPSSSASYDSHSIVPSKPFRLSAIKKTKLVTHLLYFIKITSEYLTRNTKNYNTSNVYKPISLYSDACKLSNTSDTLKS